MINKNKIIDEKIKLEIAMEQDYNYLQIVKAISRAKDQLGYLTLRQIAQAVMLGVGDDFPIFLEILVQKLNKIATSKVATKNKMKHYTIYFKSHFNAPDYEDETKAETREEAMKIFISRCPELRNIDEQDLFKNIWCEEDLDNSKN